MIPRAAAEGPYPANVCVDVDVDVDVYVYVDAFR